MFIVSIYCMLLQIKIFDNFFESLESVDNFLSYPFHRQTAKHKNITALANVKTNNENWEIRCCQPINPILKKWTWPQMAKTL